MLNGSVLVTGSSRGLGLEFTRQLAARLTQKGGCPDSVILATCRNPDGADQLQQLASEYPNRILIKRLDVVEVDSFASFVQKEVQPAVHKTGGLGYLINNAGMPLKPAKYDSVTAKQMSDAFLTHVTGPFMLTKTLVPVLKRHSLVMNLSTILGSIKSNGTNPANSGGMYPYRSSKVSLNMISRTLSLDLKPLDISVIAVHPGWVRTDLGGPKAPLTPEDSVRSMLDNVLLCKFDDEKFNGNFVDWKGRPLAF